MLCLAKVKLSFLIASYTLVFLCAFLPLCRCAAACLAHADAVSGKSDALMLASHMLTPVAVDKMPDWAKEYVRGQEDAFASQLVSVMSGNICCL